MTTNVFSSLTILVVDDDPRIRELLRTSMEAEGFRVLEASSSDELYDKLQSDVIDLITMDVLLDRENGLDLVRDIRRHSDIPIILVTGRGEEIDTVVGLEIGADDYIAKPFSIRELIARVRTVLRRARTTPSTYNTPLIKHVKPDDTIDAIRFGDWTLVPASRELRDTNDALVKLTATEYDLLEIFINNPQRALSRDQLMEKLTGRDWQPNDRVIDNHIAQLRKKIESGDGDPAEWIKTVRGTGYMFTGKTIREELEL